MEQSENEFYLRQIRIYKIKIIADVILIIVLSLIFIYVFSELENFKTLGQDVCKLCEQKTGALCLIYP